MTGLRQKGSVKAAPKNRPAEISLARKAAFNVLLAVERGHSHSDDLLRGKAVNALSAGDRNLATALVLGVIRWQIRLDHQLQSLLNRPGGKLDAEIRIALRLGAFQILHMDRIPARAAIDESVELAKQAGHRFASGMVNAVLRKLAGASPVHYSEECATELALAEAHPTWMVERWTCFYGLAGARAQSAATGKRSLHRSFASTARPSNPNLLRLASPWNLGNCSSQPALLPPVMWHRPWPLTGGECACRMKARNLWPKLPRQRNLNTSE